MNVKCVIVFLLNECKKTSFAAENYLHEKTAISGGLT